MFPHVALGIALWWDLLLLLSAPEIDSLSKLSGWVQCSHKDPQMWKEGLQRGRVMGKDSAHLCWL